MRTYPLHQGHRQTAICGQVLLFSPLTSVAFITLWLQKADAPLPMKKHEVPGEETPLATADRATKHVQQYFHQTLPVVAGYKWTEQQPLCPFDSRHPETNTPSTHLYVLPIISVALKSAGTPRGTALPAEEAPPPFPPPRRRDASLSISSTYFFALILKKEQAGHKQTAARPSDWKDLG